MMGEYMRERKGLEIYIMGEYIEEESKGSGRYMIGEYIEKKIQEGEEEERRAEDCKAQESRKAQKCRSGRLINQKREKEDK